MSESAGAPASDVCFSLAKQARRRRRSSDSLVVQTSRLSAGCRDACFAAQRLVRSPVVASITRSVGATTSIAIGRVTGPARGCANSLGLGAATVARRIRPRRLRRPRDPLRDAEQRPQSAAV